MNNTNTGGPAFPRTGENFQSINEEGMTQHIIAYEVGEHTYTCKVDAPDWDTAERHLLAVASTGRVSGRHVCDVPMDEREPLTDEEIYECERIAAIRHHRHKNSIHGQQITPADDPQWHFARAIERAHGIGGDAA